MIGHARARFVRVSPRKTRQVMDAVRGKNIESAFAILENIDKGAAFYIIQLLKSGLDSAIKNSKGTADASNIYISKITADGGPMLKRYRAGSMGRAMPIRRRMSHLTVELDFIKKPVIEENVKHKRAKTKTQKTVKKEKHGA